MFQRLPSTFSISTKKVKKSVINAVSQAAKDLHMSYAIATGLKIDEFNENHPETARLVRKHFLGAAMKAEFANPVGKVLIAVPLIGIGTVNPFPGDISTGVLLLASTFRQAKRFAREVIDEIDGTLEQRQFQDAVKCITDTSDPEKHIILYQRPTCSQQ